MFAPGFAPYEASENLANSKLALAFLSAGWGVEVISRVDEGLQYSSGAWQEPWLPLKEITHEITYRTGSRIGRALDAAGQTLRLGHLVPGLRWAGRALDLALKLHKERNYQVILSRSPNDVGHLPAMMLAAKTGLPWVANWNDPPAHLWPAPYDHRLGVLGTASYQRLARAVAERATINTFPSERLMRHVLGNVGARGHGKVAVIPHVGWGDSELGCSPRDGFFKLCHAGNLSRERTPEPFFQGIAEFARRTGAGERLRLEVIGVEDVGMLRLARTHGLERNLQVVGPLPYKDTLKQLAQNAVLIVLEAPCEEGIFLPSKVADYAQVGRPILAVSPENGTMSDLLRQHGGGLAADCRSPKAIADALTILFRSWQEGTLDSEYGSGRLYHLFSPARITSLYRDLFERVGVLARARALPCALGGAATQ